MNKLSNERRAQVVRCLVEGNSIRSTVRMTGVAKNTIAGGLLIVAGVASVMRVQSPPARQSTIIVPAGVAKSIPAD